MLLIEKEKDLAKHVVSFLEGFSENISDQDREVIQNWMFAELDHERQAWKKQVQICFSEIDKERQTAKRMCVAVKQLNVLFTPFQHSLVVHRESSVYHAAEADDKTREVEQLRKNINAFMILLESERQAKQLLVEQLQQLQDSTTPSEKELTAKVDDLEKQLAVAEKENKEGTQRLMKEVKLLNETVDLQKKVLDDEKSNYRMKTAELKQTIASLKTAKKAQDMLLRRTLKCTATQTTAVDRKEQWCQTEKVNRPRPKLSFDGNTAKPTVLPEILKRPNSCNTYQTEEHESAGVQQPSRADNANITNRSEDDSGGIEVKSGQWVKPDDVEQLKEEKQHLKSSLAQLKKYLAVYASDAERARQKMYYYREQLTAVVKARPLKEVLSLTESLPENFGAPVVREGRKLGKLHGVQIVAEEGGKHIAKRQGKRAGGRKVKCLRCNSVYAVRDNHSHACRFHTQSKKIYEKYSSRGDLIKVFHIWECCQQHEEAIGCQTAQHISL